MWQVLVVAAAVAVTAVIAFLLAGWPPPPPPPPRPDTPAVRPTAAAETAAGPTGSSRPVLVVLGDTFTAPSPASAGPEWPTLLGASLGWDVVVEAVPGSGYVSAGEGEPFAARVPDVLERSPDVIIVAGGVADLGVHPMTQVVGAAGEVVGRLAQGAPGARIVVVSPFSNGEPGPLTEQLSAQLRAIADRQGAGYVDATEWLVPGDAYFDDDPSHPADAGQRRLAQNLRRALVGLGVAPQPPPR